MKKNALLTRLITISFILVFLIGCKKETSDQLTPQQEEEAATIAAESQTESEFIFNDVFDNVMGVNTTVGIGGTGVFGKMAFSADEAPGREMDVDSIHCFTVQLTHLNPPQIFPVKIVIDFGNGCTGADGHTRYGKIITVYTARLTNNGASATTTFDGFKIDHISVQGTHKITNTTGNTPGGNLKQFTIEIRDARLSKPNGNYTEWRSDRVLTQIEGNGTILPVDDILRIEGSARGRVKRGNVLVAWQSEITEPLIKKFTCRWISKGVVRTRRESLSSTSPWVAVLNFGNGNCDYLATLSINGITHNIELPH